MKKLFLGAAVAMSSFALAQTGNTYGATSGTADSPLTFGIKAGLNVSSISKDGYESAKSKVGFAGGVFANIPVAESFNIQPELLYSMMGAKTNTKIGGVTYENTQNLDYITIPVMFQYRFIPEFYIEAGPEFGFLVNAKFKDEVKTDFINGIGNRDLKDYRSTFNMGAGIGLGYDFTPNIGVNARYIAGFTDINKKPDGSEGNTGWYNGDNKNRNNAFQFGLYYKF